MQIRRPGLWIFFALMMLYSIFITGEGLSQIAADTAKAVASYPLLYVVASNVSTGQLLLPLCVGCLLADRLVRDRQLKTSELLSSLGCPLHARLLGKYLGL
ncbi:hypothetical protein EPA93_37820 [Ktedonosporobacter rubrisoli]|uniref:Uncharacterized protein n=1 Tax=Ktedonosporobacter rubrisoli TaxID=2509675 RepID=A0A4P6K1S5_KTERU|nr:hypothetical protein [Ktedonosporobacter rubrisoli]QBD81426.1 hypothetical protein EPA93_37820 [Ktedonosporobacter rubrisoli]